MMFLSFLPQSNAPAILLRIGQSLPETTDGEWNLLKNGWFGDGMNEFNVMAIGLLLDSLVDPPQIPRIIEFI